MSLTPTLTLMAIIKRPKKGELRRLNEEFLADQAAIFKNTALLNDCKPTK